MRVVKVVEQPTLVWSSAAEWAILDTNGEIVALFVDQYDADTAFRAILKANTYDCEDCDKCFTLVKVRIMA